MAAFRITRGAGTPKIAYWKVGKLASHSVGTSFTKSTIPALGPWPGICWAMLRRSVLLLAVAAAVAARADVTVLKDAVFMGSPRGSRSLVRRDPVEAMFVNGTGVAIGDFTGWTPAKAGGDGSFTGREAQGGYLAFTVDSPEDKPVFLEAPGSGVVYVNGAPRAGDPYSYGYMSLPLQLRKGKNYIVCQTGRGRLQVKLSDVDKPVSIDPRDATTPDVLAYGDVSTSPAAFNIRNATGREVTVRLDSGAGRSAPTTIPAWSFRKVGVEAPLNPKHPKIHVAVFADGKEVDGVEVSLAVRKPGEAFKVTFWSKIDGSVQYYAVRPSTNPGPGQALFLSLHGASVEALGQAQAYGPHSWGYIVAPTNRRPYGFDWEDAGRLDALEVLRLAEKRFKTDPRMTYLTGHSMGGHGTWQLGAHYPGLFAAIAACSGWVSFSSYAGGARWDADDHVQSVLQRAGDPSDTLGLKRNYWQEGVFILHGEQDDNVPVTEARTMRKELDGHPDIRYHEVPGVGHWYDTTPDAGADCMDWPGIFDMFAHHRLPGDNDLRDIDFTTMSPSISAKDHWVTVLQQEHCLAPSHVVVHADIAAHKITGTTSNVASLSFDVAGWGGSSWTYRLDGQTVIGSDSGRLYKSNGSWRFTPVPLPESQKSPERGSGFKSVFDNGFLLVYGTHGSADENAWAASLARFIGESFAYRGNGSVEAVSDTDFLADKRPGRNVLLIGDREANSAWTSLVDREVVAAKGSVTIGGRVLSGPGLAVVALRPRLGDPTALVGIVAGTDVAGARLCDRMPFFTSGAAFPDAVVVDKSMLDKGATAVIAAGFFGNDWRAATGDWAWR